MALVFRFEDGAGTLRLDLANTSGFEVARGLDVGSAPIVHEFMHQAPHNGAVSAASWRPETVMTIPLIVNRQANMAAIKTLWDSLVTELDRETNIIRFQPDGAAAHTLYDTYRAEIPSLYRGQAAPFIGGTLLEDVELVTLIIPREPVPRGAGYV